MRTDENHSSGNRCACCNEGGQCRGDHERRPAINRRRFLAVGSGCVLGAWGGASGASTDKSPPVDIGSVKNFAQDGISEEFTQHDFFVIRYQGRLFAASTTCPHMGNLLQRDPLDATRIKCGAHGSIFDAEGVVVVGPASSGLIRLGIVVNAEGHVMVSPSKEFPQDKWTDKACYVEVK
ncbi:MAG: Rieske 2Fe-2S domain-containing protein [Verrucomicrobia bacterium]|nr:Rieske 2Fe-2S domain-containing protein [Verrucomicrobiota bacterium]